MKEEKQTSTRKKQGKKNKTDRIYSKVKERRTNMNGQEDIMKATDKR
jgi:hypothetical protein